MRLTPSAAALIALAGCTTAIPESGPGFDDHAGYDRARAAREAQLSGDALPAPGAVSSETLGPADGTGGDDATRLAADARAALQGSRQARRDGGNPGRAALDASPDNPAPSTVTNTVGISVENDFEAVDARRSIEDDAERIARNRARYEVVEPKARTARPGDTGPNVVEYALRTDHPVGTQVWRRVGLNLESRAARACAGYSSGDRAQLAFLDRGGPQRDRLGLDPDGDGYACGWDPAPYRRAVTN